MSIATALMAAKIGVDAFSAWRAERGQSAANAGTMSFNAEEAQKQREWEQWMMEHRYQMARKDLEAAGYNPLLALGANPPLAHGAAASAQLQSTTAESSKILSQMPEQSASAYYMVQQGKKAGAEAQSASAMANIMTKVGKMVNTKAGMALLGTWLFGKAVSPVVSTGKGVWDKLGKIRMLGRRRFPF